MVNRILIRIKVVQMLYAYLISRTEFKIDTNTEGNSAEKRFVGMAYVDLLLLILELTGHNTTNLNARSSYVIDRKLAASAVGQSLAVDMSIRDIIAKGRHDMSEFSDLVQALHNEITNSAIFNDFKRKRKHDLEDEVEMWTVIVKSIFANNADLVAAMRRLPGFSMSGFETSIDKVIATLRSYYMVRNSHYRAEKNLERSLNKAYAMYAAMFVLIVRLTEARERQLDVAKSKYLATAEDKNPNTRFVDNAFAMALSRDERIADYVKTYGISWTDDYVLLQSLLQSIMASSIYKDYMEAESTSWEADCEFWRQILRNVIFQSDDLLEAMENESIFWNDDLHIIGTFVLKTIRAAAVNEDHFIDFLPQFKDEEDSRFGAELFGYAVSNRVQYYEYIEQFVNKSNWEPERIAFMDGVIMLCALAEIINFPNIPLPVSLNEYIDIANIYSTPKSGQFINGVLYNVVEHLKEQGIVVK